MTIVLVNLLVMFVRDCGKIYGVVEFEDCEGFVKVWKLGRTKMIDFDLWLIGSQKIKHLSL